MKLINIIFASAMLAVVGCASATTKVLAPAASASKSASMKIEHGEDTVKVEEEYQAFFRERLAENLFGEGGFTEADGMTLRYRFIQVNDGSRFQRYMLGPIAGKGTMAIEIVYLDSAGAEISRVETGGEISGGVFGGSFKSALKKAAKETSEYARSNYLP